MRTTTSFKIYLYRLNVQIRLNHFQFLIFSTHVLFAALVELHAVPFYKEQLEKLTSSCS